LSKLFRIHFDQSGLIW